MYRLEINEKGIIDIFDQYGNKIVYLKDTLTLEQKQGCQFVTVTLLCPPNKEKPIKKTSI